MSGTGGRCAGEKIKGRAERDTGAEGSEERRQREGGREGRQRKGRRRDGMGRVEEKDDKGRVGGRTAWGGWKRGTTKEG